MQLCCVINSLPHILVELAKRSLAFLMLTIFMLAPVVEVLHSHTGADEHLTVILTDQASSCHTEMSVEDPQQSSCGQTVDILHIKCKICDHFAHQQPVSSFEVPTLELIHFDGKVSTVTPVFDDRLLSLPGLSQTNKGPPAIV
jgi:hypothetical protein